MCLRKILKKNVKQECRQMKNIKGHQRLNRWTKKRIRQWKKELKKFQKIQHRETKIQKTGENYFPRIFQKQLKIQSQVRKSNS